MIKNGIKNYFRNLKYFFTPLGTIALGVVFGLSAAIPAINAAIKELFESIKELADSSSIEYAEFFNSFWLQVKALEWSSPVDAIETLFDKEWLTTALNNCMYGSMSVEIMQVEELVNQCFVNITLAFVVFAIFTAIGFIGGFFVTKWLIRREIARRSIWKYFLISFIDSLLGATLVTLSLWILTLWKVGVIISAFASVILFGFIELFEAYIAHAWKKINFKKVVNVKNIGLLFCSNTIIFLISGVFVSLVIAIFNSFVGLFVGMALTEIAFIVIGLNAESYVKSAVADGNAEKEASLSFDKSRTDASKKIEVKKEKPAIKSRSTEQNAKSLPCRNNPKAVSAKTSQKEKECASDKVEIAEDKVSSDKAK